MLQNKKVVLKAEEGVNFKVTEGDNNQILITAFKATATDTCSANYTNPPIPDRYEHICGEWNNGFVIERKSDGSQFVWVPAGNLKYIKIDEQCESIKKYGGFYISRFNISEGLKGKPQSVKGVEPWVDITWRKAKKIASYMENGNIESHLTYDCEYNHTINWFVETGAITSRQVRIDSGGLGNYWRPSSIFDLSPNNLEKTGSCEDWCINNVYDLIGNVFEFTQKGKDYNISDDIVIRGGSFKTTGVERPAGAYRGYFYSDKIHGCDIGFRVVFHIK